ncbi:MAG: ABC transporter permease [Anaerolineales bacterium]|nr:ABC transporter permease [Anaerolineales bacterium]
MEENILLTEPRLVPPASVPKRRASLYQHAFRRFIKNKIALLGLGLVAVQILIAIFASVIAPYDPLAVDMKTVLAPPLTPGHLLGTDDLGRDMVSRLAYGARISFGVGLVVVLIAISIGVPLGALAGYFQRLDPWISFVIEVLLAFPGIILALAIVAALGPGLLSVMIAVGITSVPMYVRVVRGQVLSLKQRDYVVSARALGMSEGGILFRQILPNCLGPIIVQATINIGTSILQAASLSFIGVGVQPPQPEWGAMLSQARSYIILAPHIVALPGIAIMSVVLGFNLLGDGLRDALDPRFIR